jgi:MFS superfamily sulfate permease-like transporter
VGSRPRVVILRMRHVLAMDATGLNALEGVAARFRHQGTTLLLSGVHAQPLVAMDRSGEHPQIRLHGVVRRGGVRGAVLVLEGARRAELRRLARRRSSVTRFSRKADSYR